MNKHLAGRHNQKTHGHSKDTASLNVTPVIKRALDDFLDFMANSYPDITVQLYPSGNYYGHELFLRKGRIKMHTRLETQDNEVESQQWNEKPPNPNTDPVGSSAYIDLVRANEKACRAIGLKRLHTHLYSMPAALAAHRGYYFSYDNDRIADNETNPAILAATQVLRRMQNSWTGDPLAPPALNAVNIQDFVNTQARALRQLQTVYHLSTGYNTPQETLMLNRDLDVAPSNISNLYNAIKSDTGAETSRIQPGMLIADVFNIPHPEHPEVPLYTEYLCLPHIEIGITKDLR